MAKPISHYQVNPFLNTEDNYDEKDSIGLTALEVPRIVPKRAAYQKSRLMKKSLRVHIYYEFETATKLWPNIGKIQNLQSLCHKFQKMYYLWNRSLVVATTP